MKESNVVESVRDGKTYRKASYSATGSVTFTLKKHNAKDITTLSIDASSSKSFESEIEMPKKQKYGSSSWRPLVNSLLSIDEEKDAIEAQQKGLSESIYKDLDVELAQKIVAKITPIEHTASLEFEDSEKDMKGIVVDVENNNYEVAYNQLMELRSTNRGDVFYNLGVVQEARQIYGNACLFYAKAYQLNPKKLYFDQQNDCEKRKAEVEKFNNLK